MEKRSYSSTKASSEAEESKRKRRKREKTTQKAKTGKKFGLVFKAEQVDDDLGDEEDCNMDDSDKKYYMMTLEGSVDSNVDINDDDDDDDDNDGNGDDDDIPNVDGEEIIPCGDRDGSDVHVDMDGDGLGMKGHTGDGSRVSNSLSNLSPATKQKNRSGLYRPLTREEMQSLKETENLFKSNLLRLQINELLAEVSPGQHKKPSGLEEYLKHLKVFLQSLPVSEPLSIVEAISSLPKEIKYPLPMGCGNSKVFFTFRPPSSIKVVGSWLIKTCFRKNYDVNLSLEMPQSCLQEKDYLNHKYFHKRALYLCVLVRHLKSSGLCKEIVFSNFKGDRHTPVISIVPVDERIRHCTVRLHPCVRTSLTKLTRLGPDRNCVREFTLRKHTVEAERSGDDIVSLTPHYNNSLILETTGLFEKHLEEIFVTAQTCAAFRDAVILLKTWLHQRKLDEGFGCVNGFLVSMLLVYLVKKKSVNHMMSSYQILRVFWTFVSSSKWNTEGITLSEDDGTGPSLDVFHKAFDVVFIDSSGWYNLCGDVDITRYQTFKHESTLALAMLDSTSMDGFERLFMSTVVFMEHFDMLFHIDLASAIKAYAKTSKMSDHVGRVLDFGANLKHKIMSDMSAMLVRGLGKRVRLVAFQPEHPAKWRVSKKQPSPDNHVTLGLLLDTDHAFVVIEMGPAADSVEANEFRQFWGEKSQMRRFQDGSIKEAVLWSGDTAAERRTIPHQIISYLMEKYFGISGPAVQYQGRSVEKLISLSSYSATKAGGGVVASTGEESQQEVMKVFSELSGQLRDIPDLPLAVNSLQGTSPLFRQTEVFPPVAWNGKISKKSTADPTSEVQPHNFYPSPDGPIPRHVPALEVICQLESSGKWPDNLDAISHIKTAFYVSLSEQLKSCCNLLSSPTVNYIDILKDGFVFRVKIVYEREIALMREELKFMSGERAKRYKTLINSTETELLKTPVLTSMLSGVAHRYPCYGSAARLAKRWICSQMFSSHVSQDAVDLIVASVFLSLTTHTPPATPLCAFLRFLKLLGQFKWGTAPLIVNFNNELSDDDIADIQTNFTSNRSTLPSMFIATPTDRHASLVSQHHPDMPILAHLQNVARKAYSVLSEQLKSPNISCEGAVSPSSDVKHIFRPSLKPFDILIHLNVKYLARRHLAVDPKTTDGGTTALPPLASMYKHLPVVDFDPVEKYIKELEDLYSDFVVFFYDMFGGPVIGAVWKPNVLQSKPFKVSKANCVKVTSKKGKQVSEVSLDVNSIAGDFKLLGQGLVSMVELVRSIN